MTTITALPPAPSRTDPDTFSSKSDALLGALDGFVTETNTVAGECVTNAATATTQAGIATTQAGIATTEAGNAATSAGTATTQAGIATTQASNAAASAVNASTYAAALQATSTTSLLIEIASKSFTTQSGKQFAAGQWVVAVSAANNANYMFGQVTSYASTTLVVNVTVIGGIGTLADWNIYLSGPQGATGATGDVSLNGVQTLTNKTLTAPTLADSQLIRAMLIDCGMTVVDKGNSGTSTQTYDYTAGSVQTSTATGNHTIAFSNFPPTGNLGQILILLTNGGAYTLTWPTVNWIKPDGTTTTSISTYLAALTGRTALQSSGVDQILLWSRDAGTTIYGKLI